MFKPFALALIRGLTVSGAAAAQGVNTADVNIVSVRGRGSEGRFRLHRRDQQPKR